MGNRLTQIATRTGDDGTTALGSGERRPKYDLRVSAYGTVLSARSGRHRGGRALSGGRGVVAPGNPARRESFLITEELTNTISMEDLALEWARRRYAREWSVVQTEIEEENKRAQEAAA